MKTKIAYIEMLIFEKGFDPEDFGLILTMLDSNDRRSAKEQLDEGYQHGGGWRPQEGFKFDKHTGAMTYPGDPPFKPRAAIKLRHELVVLYPFDYVAIMPDDKSTFEICRMD
jgi:hypothetical protein